MSEKPTASPHVPRGTRAIRRFLFAATAVVVVGMAAAVAAPILQMVRAHQFVRTVETSSVQNVECRYETGHWLGRAVRACLSEDAYVLGVDGLIHLRLESETALDSELTRLGWFPELESLALQGSVVHDESWETLQGLRKLRSLSVACSTPMGPLVRRIGQLESVEELQLEADESLPGGRILDEDLSFLSGLKNLKGLDLSGHAITDRGLERIVRCERLETLVLRDCRITDAGLEKLRKLESLESLDLGGTQVTDAGIRHLSQIRKLKVLVLDGTPVTGLGVLDASRQNGKDDVPNFPALETLTLSDTRVTDEGASAIAMSQLKTLVSLDLCGTSLTSVGVTVLLNECETNEVYVSEPLTDDVRSDRLFPGTQGNMVPEVAKRYSGRAEFGHYGCIF